MRGRKRGLAFAILLCLALLSPGLPTLVSSQGTEADVDSLLARMTPSERVGQLFVVGFSPASEAEIVRLVRDYHIGGVVLAARNGNLPPSLADAAALRDLIGALQGAALAGAVGVPAGTPSTTPAPAPTVAATPPATANQEYVAIPLFVAMDEADLGLVSGEGGLPAQLSAMALGATWDESAVERAGRVAGRLLRALGVNVLLGPPLDVANPTRAGLAGDLGVHTFGESPHWVSVLGRAYVRGAHTGSEGHVLIVGTHFPGLGAADRDVYVEVPIVQDSLENRLATDLLPFTALVRPKSPEADDTLDGILATHVQFHSVNGNTLMVRPASLDPQALSHFLSLPQVAPWRESGGLVVGDSLGARSVRQYYDPKSEGFQAKRAAYEAFLAGNDILILDMVSPSADDWNGHFASVRETLDFFQAKYQSDAAFRSRVDASVRRILAAKLRLYPRFSVDAVIPEPALLQSVGEDAQAVSEIASKAVTLVYPRPEELAAKMPAPPSAGDRLVIVEDVVAFTPCVECEPLEQPAPGTTLRLLQRLYGQEGSGHVDMARVQSFTFEDLAGLLAGSEAESAVRLQAALSEANWVLFMVQGHGAPEGGGANPLATLLREQPALVRDKRVVVFALGAPYDLDSTDVAKTTVYYALYSATEPAIETGLRALFGEIVPVGKLPVSVPAVQYRLSEWLQPAADQLLYLEPLGAPEGEGGQVTLGLGDELALATGVILDCNGNVVPDGTAVTFMFYDSESRLSWQEMGATTDGRATVRLRLQRPGTVEVTVAAGPAARSAKLLVTVRGDQPAVISTMVPTPVPTATPQPTPAAIFPGETALPIPPSRPLDIYAFMLSLSGILGLSAASGALAYARSGRIVAVETALLALCAGLVGYLTYGLLGLALGRTVVLEGMQRAIPWRWQPAILSYMLCGVTGLVGWLAPAAVAKTAHTLRRATGGAASEPQGHEQRR
ncbi:MAG: hypothetical protein H5T65_07325 [Chloroflexi bacterium]|nr:hypothetical protein [Chloroflexota bacterium]